MENPILDAIYVMVAGGYMIASCTVEKTNEHWVVCVKQSATNKPEMRPATDDDVEGCLPGGVIIGDDGLITATVWERPSDMQETINQCADIETQAICAAWILGAWDIAKTLTGGYFFKPTWGAQPYIVDDRVRRDNTLTPDGHRDGIITNASEHRWATRKGCLPVCRLGGQQND